MAQRDGLEIFVRVAESGSFRKAATGLGLSPAAVSNAIARLEERLQIRLINRTTRALQLTESGRLLFQRLKPALLEIERAQAEAMEGGDLPRGKLRIAAPEAFGRMMIAPKLPEFLATFPKVEIDLFNDDRLVDVVQENFDVAIRFGPLADSALISRLLLRNRRVTLASPAYLSTSTPLATPDDLDRHQCIGFAPGAGGPLPWHFRDADTHFDRRPPFRAILNQVDSVVAMAAGQGGVIQVLDFAARTDLAEGRLVEVLNDWGFEDRPVFIVWPGKRHLPAKTRAFIEWISHSFSTR